MTTLLSTDLSIVVGGAGTADASKTKFRAGLKKNLEGRYKSFVCDSAGYEGAPEFASQMYGSTATGDDFDRATKAITEMCNGGRNLPAKAPPFPLK
jgi:hypothetical protein